MTESFEDVMAFMRKAITDDCDQTYCAMYDDDCYACEGAVLDRLQRAHDHEMEQLRRSRFHEGYEAGQRSMDAAHYQLKLRLQGLRFGDGSHENLSRLAYAIYQCPTGWGKESCEGLRDKLIELLGGVHDEQPTPSPTACGACDTDCAGHGGEPQTVAYDELGNERHKVVCELRKLPDWYTHDGKKYIEYEGDCLTFRDGFGGELKLVNCDILLNGKSFMDALMDGTDEPDSQESSILSNCDTENGGEVTITDELRKWASDRHCKGISHTDVLNIGLIADRIDEQFNHAMISRNAELGCYKLHINQLEQERDKLKKKLDGARGVNRHITRQWDISNKKRRELQKKLDTIREALDG